MKKNKVLIVTSVLVVFLMIVMQIFTINYYVSDVEYKFTGGIIPNITIVIILIAGSYLIYRKYKGRDVSHLITYLGLLISQFFLILDNTIRLIIGRTLFSFVAIALGTIFFVGSIIIAVAYRRIIFKNYYKNKEIIDYLG